MQLRRLFYCLANFVILAFAVSATFAAPPQLPGWNVSWFDEFDGSSINTNLWNVISSTQPTNNSLQAYLPSQVSVSGGNLVITATDSPFGNLDYRSGQVISKAHRRLGKWEVRAKLPTSKGQWPAIWLLPDTGQHPWPSQGEIDIMENRGDQPFLTSSAFHYGTNPPFNHDFVYGEQVSHESGARNDYHAGFHTYGVEWSEDVLRFFVDGVNHYNVHDDDVGGFISSQTAPMQTVINNAIGGNFLDNPDSSTVWPQEMLIDYVHMYSPAATSAPLEHTNGSFEGTANPDHSPLADWSVFGSGGAGNVSPHNAHARTGTHALKLFGQFASVTNFSGAEQGITVSGGEEVRAIVRHLVDSGDSISDSNNEVVVNIDYYRQKHGKYGSSDYISTASILVADGSMANDVWLDSELRSTAPAGAVEARMALVFIQPNQQGGAVYIDDTVFGRRGDTELMWDGNGNGLWNSSRWQGTGPSFPVDFDRAVIRNDRVVVTGNQAAFHTEVESGHLFIAGQLTSDVHVAAAGFISNRGTIVGDLSIDGVLLIDASGALQVDGSVDVTSAELELDGAYNQASGTYSGQFAAISADALIGDLTLSDGDYLGDGFFLNSVSVVGDDLVIDLYAAIPGDANGDGSVNGTDFELWSQYKFQSGTDWTSGDFNGDGLTDGHDFLILNSNKFTTADRPSAVPEPKMSVLVLLGIAALVRHR